MEKISGVLEKVFSSLTVVSSPQQKLAQNWEKIAGSKIAKISRAFVSKKKVMYVEVSDGGYAFEIRQRYAPALLKRAQALLGEENILDIRVIVKP